MEKKKISSKESLENLRQQLFVAEGKGDTKLARQIMAIIKCLEGKESSDKRSRKGTQTK
jgi:hypothetical protein